MKRVFRPGIINDRPAVVRLTASRFSPRCSRQYHLAGVLRFAIASVLLMTGSFEAKAIVKQKIQTAPVLSQADVTQWAGGLGLVIFLILVSAWILRRFNQVSMSQGNRLKILGGLSVGTRERVILLQVGEKQLLLGVAPGRVETLHVLQPGDFARDDDENSNGSTTGNFAERLRQTVRGQ